MRLLLLLLAIGSVVAATTYRYECPKCHLVQEFTRIGVRK